MNVRDRILGGLWGALVGDALGVPVEFKDRETRRSDPVKDMRGFGSHNQPPGTWSDDGALTLCTVESLLHAKFDTQDMGERFVRWLQQGLWTSHGKVFDVGLATSRALGQIAGGMRAEVAGGDSQSSNGNGSLMRIIPVSLRYANAPIKLLLERVHRASAITHRHPRSQMACGFHSLVIRELLQGSGLSDSFARALDAFRAYYEADAYWAVELDYFQQLLGGNIATHRESEVHSSGYVVHTLTASLWCLLTTDSFEECVLRAVNLGGDTDTTGCVAGGLAGVHYGIGAIPDGWRNALPRREELTHLFECFSDRIEMANPK